jgi:cytosine deaminase
MAAGVNVAFGHDCVMDPWYPLGSGDMLEVAQMGLHVAQMTSPAQIAACFDAVTVNGAQALGLDRHGIAVGCDADLVLLQARSVVEAVRLRANRLRVWRRGRQVAGSVPAVSQLSLPGRPASVDWTLSR